MTDDDLYAKFDKLSTLEKTMTMTMLAWESTLRKPNRSKAEIHDIMFKHLYMVKLTSILTTLEAILETHLQGKALEREKHRILERLNTATTKLKDLPMYREETLQ